MLHYQKELNNLSNETIKAIEDYTEDNFTEELFYQVGREYDELRNDEDRVYYLEQLADDLNLSQFNLTVYQAIIIAYMFVNDLFGRSYVYEVLKIMENTLL